MTQQFTTETGHTLTVDDDTVADLKALSTLTREPEEVLLAAAIEALRSARLRTAAARPASTPKGRKVAQ